MPTFYKNIFCLTLCFFSLTSSCMEPWDVWAITKFWQENDREAKASEIGRENRQLINRIILLQSTNAPLNMCQMKELLVKEIPLDLDRAISLYNAAIAVSFPFGAQFVAYAVCAQRLPFNHWDFHWDDSTKIKPHRSFYKEIARQEYLFNKEQTHSMSFFLSVRELVEHGCIAEKYQKSKELPFYTFDEKINSLDGLGNLYRLTYVRSLGGQITTIEESDTHGLTQLKKLWVGRHRLHSIPGIATLTTLTELDLSANQLTNAALCLSGLHALVTLDLGHNQLTSLAPLVTLTQLKSLDVNGNQITTLPEDELRSHQQLTQLEAGSNWNKDQKKAITHIEGVYLLTNLRNLELDRNQLADIKPEITLLANLTKFQLNENKITHLGPLALLSSLTDLQVRHNKITNVSLQEIERLRKISSLTSLGLGGNHIPKDTKARIKDALSHVEWVTFDHYMHHEEFRDED